MPREAEKSVVDGAPRSHHAPHAPSSLSWWRPQPRWLPAAAFGALLLSAAFGFWLRGAAAARRRRLDFPPPAKLDALIASAQDRLKANPQDLDALVQLGTLHFEKGKDSYADGINELEEARDLGALDPRVFYCLGIMYQEAGLYSFAIEDYRRYLRHYPEDKEIRMLLAKLLYKQGSFAEAVEEYERLKFRFPKDLLVEENLGLSLWGAKDIDRAVANFSQMSLVGGDAGRRAEFYLGQMALDRKDYPGALEHLLKAEPDPPHDIGVPQEKLQAALGTAYAKLNRWEEAKAAWERVLTLTPSDSKARSALREASRRIPRTKKKKA